MAYRGKGLPREGPALLLTTKEKVLDKVKVRFNQKSNKEGEVRAVSSRLAGVIEQARMGEIVRDKPESEPEQPDESEGSDESEESEGSDPKPDESDPKPDPKPKRKAKRKAKRQGKGTGPIAKSEVLG